MWMPRAATSVASERVDGPTLMASSARLRWPRERPPCSTFGLHASMR